MLITGLCVLGIVGIAVAAIGLSGCTIGYSFRGPGGVDRATGAVKDGVGPEALLVVTKGTVASGKQLAFLRTLDNVLGAMPDQPGLVGYSARKELLGRDVWTLSVWTDAESMRAFVRSEAHRSAMQSGTIPADAFLSVHRNVSVDELPISWDKAKAMLSAVELAHRSTSPDCPMTHASEEH